jgi:hypothetical protein
VLTKADAHQSATEHYPPFVATTDYETVETWESNDGGEWKPGQLAIRAVNPTGITEWQVVDDGRAFIAAVGLPELAASVGLPSSFLVSVQIMNPDAGTINPNAQWSLHIDVSQLFTDAVVSPLQSYLGTYGAMFTAYVSGVIKATAPLPPVVRLAIDCYWSKDSVTRGTLRSDLTVGAPRLREVGPAVVSEEICPHCHRSDDGDTWTLISGTD